MSAISPSLVTSVRPGTVLPLRRLLGAYATEVKYELLRVLRTPAYSIPFLVLPVPLYLFFGVLLAGPAVAEKPGVASFLFVSWSTFATMMPALLGVGCALAIERDAGFLKLKRALPAPAGAYLVAKTLAAMAFSALAVTSLVATALVTGTVTLTVGQLAAIATVMVLGTIPFAALGLFIGAHVSGSAAPAISNLVFLPMLWLSGLFIPLPKFLESWVIIWPAFHLNQVAVGTAGIAGFSFVPPQISAAALLAVTVLFGGLAIHRLARRG